MLEREVVLPAEEMTESADLRGSGQGHHGFSWAVGRSSIPYSIDNADNVGENERSVAAAIITPSGTGLDAASHAQETYEEMFTHCCKD
ncbi:hypothetical protein MHYP_G00039170 [Metynnis hypsauchen]